MESNNVPKVRAALAQPGIRAAIVVVLAAVVGVGVWLGVRDTGGSTVAAITAPAPAAPASEDNLKAVSSSLQQPIYWAGQSESTTYELTRLENGRIFVRYLPKGATAGSSTPYLTIGTYPVKDAFAATTAIAKQSGSVSVPVKNGVAFYSASRPTNVYVAFEDTDFQIEIYDPSPASALAAVARIAAVQTSGISLKLPAATGATAATGTDTTATPTGTDTTAAAQTTTAAATTTTPAPAKPKTVNAAQLSAAAGAAANPVYWLGAKPKVTYELTESADGRVWVRYLPIGADPKLPNLTIGSYPVANAYTATVEAAKNAGSTEIPVKGGIAFYTDASPGNVYVAFKGINVQIEVFAPDPATAQSAVKAGQLRPVR